MRYALDALVGREIAVHSDGRAMPLDGEPRAAKSALAREPNLVTVVVPSYERIAHLKECLDTIRNQTYKRIEIIVVDDGSSEKVAEKTRILAEQCGARFVRIEHAGAATARNAGAKDAFGRYLFFCDNDVVLMPDCIEKMMAALGHDWEKAFAYCSFRWNTPHHGLQVCGGGPFDPNRLRKQNYVSTMSLLRACWFGWFDEKLKRHQDWDLWLRVVKKGGRGVFVPGILFTVHGNGFISSDVKNMTFNESIATVKRKHGLA